MEELLNKPEILGFHCFLGFMGASTVFYIVLHAAVKAGKRYDLTLRKNRENTDFV